MNTQKHKYLLVTMCQDYADEFDVEGFLVVSESHFEKAKQRLRNFGDKELMLSFGTNEELFWDNAEDLLWTLDITVLTDVEVECYRNHFHLTGRPYPIFVENQDEHIIAGFGEYGFLDGVELSTYDENE